MSRGRNDNMVQRLMNQANGLCHYCNKPCSRKGGPKSSRYPTRDHVVPRSLGGKNSITNYVLACSGCNNDRGTSLFYCDCRDCVEIIYDYLYDPEALNSIFDGIINHNKPKVTCGESKWGVRIGHSKKYFDTFGEAIAFATTKTFIHDKDYS